GRFDAVRAHLERMRGLESGRALRDALGEAGGSADRPLEVSALAEFAEVARFFRLDAEARVPGPKSPQTPAARPSASSLFSSRTRSRTESDSRSLARRGSVKNDPVDVGPEATSEDASVSSDRGARDLIRSTRHDQIGAMKTPLPPVWRYAYR